MTAIMPASTPDYVHDLIDALITRTALDFRGHTVPGDVRNRLAHRTARRAPGHRPEPSQLTAREMQVLRGMAAGLQNRQIGEQLHISEDTVKTHNRRVFRKLDAHDRAHAVAIGFRTGLLV